MEELAGEVAPDHDPVRLLHGLVDASLLDVDPGRTRYRLLFTVRAFLLEEIAALGEQAASRGPVPAVGGTGRGGDRRRAASVQPRQADRRLRAELDNLRAARDLARAAGLMDVRVRITLAFDQPSVWRDLREVWSWCLELADAPETEGHAREVEIRGAGAEAARQAGDYDRAVELANVGLAVAGRTEPTPRGGTVLVRTGRRGALPRRLRRRVRDWERCSRAVGPTAAGLLASAALAAGYGGDRAHAVALLAEAREHEATTPNGSNHAFITYVEGELARRRRPRGGDRLVRRCR